MRKSVVRCKKYPLWSPCGLKKEKEKRLYDMVSTDRCAIKMMRLCQKSYGISLILYALGAVNKSTNRISVIMNCCPCLVVMERACYTCVKGLFSLSLFKFLPKQIVCNIAKVSRSVAPWLLATLCHIPQIAVVTELELCSFMSDEATR